MHDQDHTNEHDTPQPGGPNPAPVDEPLEGPQPSQPLDEPQPDLPEPPVPELPEDRAPVTEPEPQDAPPPPTTKAKSRAPAAPSQDGERIAKIMARAGVASRRDAERMILEGRVRVNGSVIRSPALDIRAADRVEIDGQPLEAPQPTRVWLYYKPVGLVTSESDEKGRQTIFDALPRDLPRVMTIGRLDLTSEGLLLLTNDGELKRRLELPSTGWMRRYRVRVNGNPNQLTFEPLRRGVEIDGEQFQPMEIEMDSQQGANAWLTVGIREGKNREIRRAMNHVGLMVNRLIRISYGPFRVTGLDKNEVREVKRRILRDQLGNLLTGEPDAPEGEGRARPERGGDAGDRGRKPRHEAGGRPAPSRSGGYGARLTRADGDRPVRSFDKGPRTGGYKPRTDDDRPARADGDRPARSFDKGPRTGGFKPRTDGERPARADGDRPARSFDKGPRTGGYKPRTDGERPARADGERPARSFDKSPRTGGYKPRTDGERPARADGDRPARSFDKGPRTGGYKSRTDGERPARADGDRPARSFDKGPRTGGYKLRTDGERPARADGDRPARSFDKGPRAGGGKGGFGAGPRAAGGGRGSKPSGPGGPRKPFGKPGR